MTFRPQTDRGDILQVADVFFLPALWGNFYQEESPASAVFCALSTEGFTWSCFHGRYDRPKGLKCFATRAHCATALCTE